MNFIWVQINKFVGFGFVDDDNNIAVVVGVVVVVVVVVVEIVVVEIVVVEIVVVVVTLAMQRFPC